jgi:hypothetical protein
MKLRKPGIVLLALLLAAMAIMPCVSAADRPMPLVDWSNVEPTQPLTEKDLITFVVSEKTLKAAYNQKDGNSIKLDQEYFQSDGGDNVISGISALNIQNNVNTNEPVAILTIPKSMYESLKQNSNENSVSVPRDMFKVYASLNEFSKYQTTLSNVARTDVGKVYTNTTPTVIVPILPKTATTGYRYQKWDEFLSDNSGIQPALLTGKISPSTYQQSPSSVFIYEEQEVHLNRLDSDGDGIDVIEIIAAYDVGSYGAPSGAPAGINLFPVFYNGDISSNPIFTGYIHVPSAPHSYNFYVNVGSGSTLGKYDVWFEDTATGQWLASYTYQDNNSPSSYIRSPRVSSELTILPGASGSFNAQTTPIILEHVLQGSTWYTPQQTYSYWRSVQNVPNLQFVSTSQGFQWWNGYLVQGSYCSGSI